MPPKKSNLNARSREARRKRAERARMSTEQTTKANATKRQRAVERRMRESSEKRDERLRLQRERSRAKRKQHVSRYRAQNRERQQTRRALKLINTIESEMEDVKEQTDTQADEKIGKTNISDVWNENFRDPKINELDKFKRRMIRAIARLLHTEKKAEADIWDDLKNETGCDCELLWSQMRALTIKKLLRLFTAEDKIQNITKIVQLSVTDWLLYDLVLVHEKVDVIGQELDNKEEPALLRDLFNLVEEFDIEYSTGEELTEKWFGATAKYNNTGKRHCSPMLLQKRWYQLKELARNNFYNFWFQYRGDSKKLERANEFKPSDLQLDIVKRYKAIVTKPFLNWEALVKEGKVALPEDFERLRLARNEFTISENEPDIEVIEQRVETIDLEETNDSNDSVNKDACNNENDFNIDIVKVESLAEQDDDMSILECVNIPLEKI